MIKIDGSKGEGGGQILRTAVAFSAVFEEPVRVGKIREKRSDPGLARQHLKALEGLSSLCRGRLEGARLGSREIEFYPGQVRGGEVTVKIKTAGSLTLVLQTLLLPALFGKETTRINFEGGATDTFFSPTLDHFRFVFLDLLAKMGVKTELRIERRGFYPEGGARLSAVVRPVENLSSLSLLKRGELKEVKMISGATRDLAEKGVAERQVSGAKGVLGKLKLPLTERTRYWKARSTGSVINIIADTEETVFGSDKLGKLGKSAEEVGKEAGLSFLKEVSSKACLDKHTGDQILPYIALARGASEITVSEITPHCRGNMRVVERFLDGEFKIKDRLISWDPK